MNVQAFILMFRMKKQGIGSVCGGSAAEIETVSGGDDGQTDFGGNSAECGR